jgi:hypothetical protein
MNQVSRRAILAAAVSRAVALRAQTAGTTGVERWGVFDVNLDGPRESNPFMDVRLSCDFRQEHRVVQVDGFYNGDGAYKIRFSPDAEGQWTYTTRSNRRELDGRTGSFVCGRPRPGNHGPVSVRKTFHFGYADGTPYFPFGTTCYAWTHQPAELQQQTIQTLRSSPFNKIRLCVFPKWYEYNRDEPRLLPFPRSGGVNDYTRFDPEFWRNLESRIVQLQSIGIQADLILFHPYDHWGYAGMPAEADERYLRYAVARLAAYRNVWWSVANEWDLVKGKQPGDWDRYFRILQQSDPYGRLRSIHHSRVMYDHGRAWVSHASIQGDDFAKILEWRDSWRKPVIFDECKYEGNIPRRWGDISAEEMTRRFWLGTVYGGYVGHGETYLDPKDILWWSKGGVLHGQSPERIAFLRHIVESGPADGLNPLANPYYPAAGQPGEFYLYYLDCHQPALASFELPADRRFQADFLHPWAMTVTSSPGTYSGKFELKMPGRPYLAVRFRREG